MRLLEKLTIVAKQRGMAESTVQCYSLWIKQFLRFSATVHREWKHPAELGTADVEAFLNDLVVSRQLAGATQNQALNALVFLYKHVLDAIPQDHLGKFLLQRSKRPKRMPTVLSASEVMRVIQAVPADHMSRLMVELMYGTGMRVSEVCTLRVRDIDLGRAQIIVRAAKGDKDRIVMLPATLAQRMGERIDRVESRWRRDVKRGGGFAPVPLSLEHKNGMRAAARGAGVADAVCVSISGAAKGFPRPRCPLACTSSIARPGGVEMGGLCGIGSRGGEQARDLPHLSAQFRDPSAGERV